MLMPDDPLVDYHGSITGMHGRYRQGPVCDCGDCEHEMCNFLADPEGTYRSPDVRWLLLDACTGAVALEHVRPESYTHVKN